MLSNCGSIGRFCSNAYAILAIIDVESKIGFVNLEFHVKNVENIHEPLTKTCKLLNFLSKVSTFENVIIGCMPHAVCRIIIVLSDFLAGHSRAFRSFYSLNCI